MSASPEVVVTGSVSALKPPAAPEFSPSLNGSAPRTPSWPTLDTAAFHGLAGRIVRTIVPETEADPAALLAQFLTAFGSAIGPGPHARAEGSNHPVRLFTIIAGKTAKARKGTSWGRVLQVMAAADPEWSMTCVKGGLSSGEGLIKAASGPDKRVLAHEGEFASVLSVAMRDGNTLSTTLRLAWDKGELSVMTKNEPLSVAGAHISLVGHITIEELRSKFTDTQAANGFGNRFLFVVAQRDPEKLLPSGGNLDESEIAGLGQEVHEAVEFARKRGIITRTSQAERAWDQLYREFAADDPGGIVGGLVQRAEAQVLRLSVAYCLLDREQRIGPVHLEAAAAVWRYCRASVAYIFGSRLGHALAEQLLVVLRGAPGQVMSLDEISAAFGRHVASRKIQAAIDVLEQRGLVARVMVRGGGGRPRTQIAVVDV